MYVEKYTKQVHWLSTSLNHNYSQFIDIDLLNNKSRICCNKMGKTSYIDIPKVIMPDFPNLNFLKEKVNKYILLS
jgi:hypothetical protein